MALTGLAYPLAVTGDGNLVTATDADLIADHIIHFLETEPGENPMRPDYGTKSVLFNAQQDFNVYAADTGRRLTAYIPEAEFRTEGGIDDNGEAHLSVFWSAFRVDDVVEAIV